MPDIVLKFGGSSLADAGRIEKLRGILKADPSRKYLVVSAPGKRSGDDLKVTDLLLRAAEAAAAGEDFSEPLGQIRARFREIISGLGICFDLDRELTVISERLPGKTSPDYAASRGEYLNARIIAEYLGWPFVDSADCVFLREDGRADEEKCDLFLREAFRELPCAVLPGFYGSGADGEIRTFSRGGSDITGALLARALGAGIYENWTDVDGMLFTDPRILEASPKIPVLTFTELRELSYMGASVLHEAAVFPVRKAGIPIHLRSSFAPEREGTWIVPELPEGYEPAPVTGVAGRKGFSIVHVDKGMMNEEIGFAARLMTIFARFGLSVEHCPTGIDTFAVVSETKPLLSVEEELLRVIREELQPDHLSVEHGVALIAAVGVGILKEKGLAARVFTAIAENGINVRMIDSGAGGMDIIISVLERDLENAIRAISREFIGGEEALSGTLTGHKF